MITTVISGRLGAKAEVKSSENGKFITFSLAVAGEKDTWVDCTYSFRGDNPPKIFEYLNIGKSVVVTGRPHARLWKATEQYPAKATLGCWVDKLELLDTKNREIVGPSNPSDEDTASEDDSTETNG